MSMMDALPDDILVEAEVFLQRTPPNLDAAKISAWQPMAWGGLFVRNSSAVHKFHAHFRLGRAYELRGNLLRAQQHLEAAISIGEQLPTWLRKDEVLEDERIDIVEQQRSCYRHLLALLLKIGQVAEALAVSERGKARGLDYILSQIRQAQCVDTAEAKDIKITIGVKCWQDVKCLVVKEEAALVEYALLDDSTLAIWLVSPHGDLFLHKTVRIGEQDDGLSCNMSVFLELVRCGLGARNQSEQLRDALIRAGGCPAKPCALAPEEDITRDLKLMRCGGETVHESEANSCWHKAPLKSGDNDIAISESLRHRHESQHLSTLSSLISGSDHIFTGSDLCLQHALEMDEHDQLLSDWVLQHAAINDQPGGLEIPATDSKYHEDAATEHCIRHYESVHCAAGARRAEGVGVPAWDYNDVSDVSDVSEDDLPDLIGKAGVRYSIGWDCNDVCEDDLPDPVGKSEARFPAARDSNKVSEDDLPDPVGTGGLRNVRIPLQQGIWDQDGFDVSPLRPLPTPASRVFDTTGHDPDKAAGASTNGGRQTRSRRQAPTATAARGPPPPRDGQGSSEGPPADEAHGLEVGATSSVRVKRGSKPAQSEPDLSRTRDPGPGLAHERQSLLEQHRSVSAWLSAVREDIRRQGTLRSVAKAGVGSEIQVTIGEANCGGISAELKAAASVQYQAATDNVAKTLCEGFALEEDARTESEAADVLDEDSELTKACKQLQQRVIGWAALREVSAEYLTVDCGVQSPAVREAFLKRIRELFDEGRLLRRLHALLIEPVQSGLQSGQELLIVPHMELFAVPWAALLDADGRYLVESHTIRLAPSLSVSYKASVAAAASALGGGSGSAGGITYTGQPRVAVVGNPCPVDASLAGIFPELEHAQDEALAVAERLRVHGDAAGSSSVTCLLRGKATKAAVTAAADSANWLHFACHGWLDRQALVLASGPALNSTTKGKVKKRQPGKKAVGRARAAISHSTSALSADAEFIATTTCPDSSTATCARSDIAVTRAGPLMADATALAEGGNTAASASASDTGKHSRKIVVELTSEAGEMGKEDHCFRPKGEPWRADLNALPGEAFLDKCPGVTGRRVNMPVGDGILVRGDDSVQGKGVRAAVSCRALWQTSNGQGHGQDFGCLLNMRDVKELALAKGSTVVLSACNTARGEVKGEGVVGLARAFLAAGAGAAVVSLWSVPDCQTAQLMDAMYAGLVRGYSTPQALRFAMLAVLHRARLRAAGAASTSAATYPCAGGHALVGPYSAVLWAGFVVTGARTIFPSSSLRQHVAVSGSQDKGLQTHTGNVNDTFGFSSVGKLRPDASVEDVCAFLEGMGADPQPAREQDVDAQMFADLTPDELAGDLSLNPAQVSFVLQTLAVMKATPTSAVENGSASTPLPEPAMSSSSSAVAALAQPSAGSIVQGVVDEIAASAARFAEEDSWWTNAV